MTLAHPEIFKTHYDSEYLLLVCFVFSEMLKPPPSEETATLKSSLWYPYFQIVNLSELPMMWSDEELSELQDTILIKDVEEYKREFEDEWQLIYKTFKAGGYDHLFPGISDESNYEFIHKTFVNAFISVVTRCFGWGLPNTMLIPYADCINHNNVDSTYELVNPRYQFEGEKGPD